MPAKISGPSNVCADTLEGSFYYYDFPEGTTWEWEFEAEGYFVPADTRNVREVKLVVTDINANEGSLKVNASDPNYSVLRQLNIGLCRVSNPCANTDCPPGQFCATGTCVDHPNYVSDIPDSPQTASYPVEVQDCSTTIGTVTISGPQQACTGEEEGDYTANYTGDAVDVTYQWSGNATFTAPTSQTTKATFNTEGTIVISCTLTSAASNDSPKSGNYTVTSAVCVVDPCDGVTCGPNEYCDNGVCKPVDPCQGVSCPTGQICVNGICEPDPNYNPCDGVVCPDGQTCVNGVCKPTGGGGGGGADEFHYRYPNHYFTSRQDTAITTRDTSELNDYEKGIGRTETVDRTLDKKIILPPDFNPNP